MTDEKYPEGKLNDEDEGFLMMAISVEKGNVRIDFKKPTQWLAMNPEMAMDVASIIISNARAAGCKKPLILKIP